MSEDGFGLWLRKVRELRGLRQDVVAERSQTFTQPALARMEAGATPRPESLKALSEIYAIPYEELLARYIGCHFFDIEPEKTPGTYEAPERTFFVTNAGKISNLAAIVKWEEGLAHAKQDRPVDLWIVAPNFLDYKDNAFLAVVVDHLLINGAHLTYFIDPADILPGCRFDIFLERVIRRLNENARDLTKLGDISAYLMSPDEMTWLTSMMVIANPESVIYGGEPEGYTIISIGGRPVFGVPLEIDDASRITGIIRKNIRDPNNQDRIKRSLLKNSPDLNKNPKG